VSPWERARQVARHHNAAPILSTFKRMTKTLFPVRHLARSLAMAVLATSAAMSLTATSAKAETFDGEYVVTFLGLPIARSRFSTTIDGDRYSVDGHVASAGIATIISSVKGKSTASGTFAGDATRPRAFRMEYSEGKRRQSTAIGFRGDQVVSTENDPPLKKRGKDWVKLEPGHLKGATDPLSAGLVRASAPEKVCRRTLKLYDGEFRLDVRLQPAPGVPRIEGYGDAVVLCRARPKPVAGYRKGRRALDYLENRSRIMIAFAPLATTGLYAPVYATVGTEIGTVTVKATRVAGPG
jgi:hypothetical protein